MAVGGVCFAFYLTKKDKKEEEAEKLAANLKEEEDSLHQLRYDVNSTFGVKLEDVHENTAQDEMVRVVNLLAFLVSEACVNQEKESRHVAVAFPPHSTHWGDYEVRIRKAKWAVARNLAIQLIPELADRLPHFSEFEPLKSYREEHLEQKRRKALQ
jgi:hypothetical protein